MRSLPGAVSVAPDATVAPVAPRIVVHIGRVVWHGDAPGDLPALQAQLQAGVAAALAAQVAGAVAAPHAATLAEQIAGPVHEAVRVIWKTSPAGDTT